MGLGAGWPIRGDDSLVVGVLGEHTGLHDAEDDYNNPLVPLNTDKICLMS